VLAEARLALRALWPCGSAGECAALRGSERSGLLVAREHLAWLGTGAHARGSKAQLRW
jgi:hypothetical protein